MYHVRAVTQTDVVRAGTKDVAKIFQILYDVEAVSGPGSVTYLGATHELQSKRSNPVLYSTIMENSMSINNTITSTINLNSTDNLSDCTLACSINKYSEDYATKLNSDAISVGSNDSGDVKVF